MSADACHALRVIPRRACRVSRWLASLACLSLAIPTEGAPAVAELIELDLASLAQVEFSSADKVARRWWEHAGAVTVLAAADLERSGATTVPEGLRLVPGASVGRVNSNAWAASLRGFNAQLSSKLLVLVDGRSVYNPLFSGVYWEALEMDVLNLDRIEVIRGPGGTVWGANAVNGVVNIVSAPAERTLGVRVLASAGTEDAWWLAARSGFRLDERWAARLTLSRRERGPAPTTTFEDGGDAWSRSSVEFRADRVTDGSRLTLLAGAGETEAGRLATVGTISESRAVFGPDAVDFGTGHASAIWEVDPGGAWAGTVRGTYDGYVRRSAVFDSRVDTYDVDAQARREEGDGDSWIFGVGGRWQRDAIEDGRDQAIGLPPVRRRVSGSAYIRREWLAAEERLRVSAGVKLEQVEGRGADWQPSVRVSWLPDAQQTWWAAVTRAVRTPARAEDGYELNTIVSPPGAPLTVYSLTTPPGVVDPESLVAVEGGWRWQPRAEFALEFAAYWNLYEDLIVSAFRGTENREDPGRLVLINSAANGARAVAGGAEVSVWWEPGPAWLVTLVGAWQRADMDAQEPGVVGAVQEVEDGHPEVQARVEATWRPDPAWALTTAVRCVGPVLGVPGYVAWDARVAWRPAPWVEVAVSGRNLADPGHPEASSISLRSGLSEVPREGRVAVTVEW